MSINHPVNPAPETEETLTTSEFMEQYETIGFLAPYVECRRKSDGQYGSMQFNGIPRYYFGFTPIQED